MSSTAGTAQHGTTKPAGTAPHVAQHAARPGRRRQTRAVAEHTLHVGKHVATLVALHVTAISVIEKTPLLTMLSLH